jgi:hypothetical protein
MLSVCADPEPMIRFVRRRAVNVCLVGLCAAAMAFAANGQGTTKVRHVGYLSLGAPQSLDDIYDELRKIGWVEGRNLHVEQRFADTALPFAPLTHAARTAAWCRLIR